MSLEGLVVENLSVWFGSRKILSNISFRVPSGSVLAVMGPSGSGKSTLLRAINRLLDHIPYARVEGEVYIDGVKVYDENPYRVRRLVGMVFQTPTPFPHLSIYDNVAIGPKLHGLAKSKEELDRIVERALKEAMLWDEVKDRLHEPPTRLSGGQQQRLALARTLALRPKVLLLDEPTANIDPQNARKLEQSVRRVAVEEDITVVVVTHTPQQALRVSDYVAFIYEGKLVEFGRTRDVALKPSHELTAMYFRGEI
ncbi:MAG: phosphate ABC transporter ATP-binding protein [Thermoproteota archaeon]